MIVHNHIGKSKNFTGGTIDFILSKYNGRFIIKVKDVTGYNWIYDNKNDIFLLKIADYMYSDISNKIEEYLIDKRNNKINEILNENT